MTQEHPITPPPELVEQWTSEAEKDHQPTVSYSLVSLFAAKAARWGADQELEACCEWLKGTAHIGIDFELIHARRPKPPSLKEQAVFAAAVLRSPDETCSIAEIEQHWHTIRCALEALPND